MADEPKKASERFAGWKKAGQGQVAQTGGSQDVLKKALALNPTLKGDKNTQEFFKEVAQARKQGVEAKTTGPVPAARPAVVLVSDPKVMPKVDANNLAHVIAATKQWLQDEDERIATAQARALQDGAAVEAALVEVTKGARDAFVALVKQVDPHLLSPKTQAVLDSEAVFLKEIAFSRDLVKR